jgi:hypothetical protein
VARGSREGFGRSGEAHLDKVRCGNVTLEYFEEEDDA